MQLLRTVHYDTITLDSEGPMPAEEAEFDAEELNRLERILLAHLGTQVREVRILAGPQGLVVTGVADSYYAKQLAQHLLMSGCGRRFAENRIWVSSPRNCQDHSTGDDRICLRRPHLIDSGCLEREGSAVEPSLVEHSRKIHGRRSAMS